MLIIGNALSASFSFIVPKYSELLHIKDDSLVFVAPKVLYSIFEQLVYYIMFWVIHGARIDFYLITSARYDNRLWDLGVDHMYSWLVEDLVVILLSLRSDSMVSMIIRVVYFTSAEFFQRVIWDPKIWLRDRL